MDLINMLLTEKPASTRKVIKTPTKSNDIYAKFVTNINKDEDETSSKSAEFDSKSPETSQSPLSPFSPTINNETNHETDEKEFEIDNDDDAFLIDDNLDRLSAQESDLKQKTQQIEEWYNLHTNALEMTQKIKQQLIEIGTDPSKQHENQPYITQNSDQLEQYLNEIKSTGKQYRAQESIQKENDLLHTIDEWQAKYEELSANHSQQTTDLEQITQKYSANKSEVKSLTESYKTSMEQMEKKHKEYIQKITGEHESVLKTQKDEQESAVSAAVAALKMKKEKELESALDACKTMEDKWIQKETEIAEYREREEAHKSLMIIWQQEKQKKNEKIHDLTQTIEELNAKMEILRGENERLNERSALHSVQMTQKEQVIGELQGKCKGKCDEIERVNGLKHLSDAKLKVAIKEIIKLREEINAKDAHKTALLSKMSEMENNGNKTEQGLNANIEALKHELDHLRYEFEHRFKAFSEHLNDAHSKLESFSVTIKNFSGNALKQSFDTELEARLKSNQELPIWRENINTQLQKTTTQIATGNMNGNGTNYVKESETHIAHIKLTGLQILQEYTSLLIRYNNLYIIHNGNNNHKTLFRRSRRTKSFSR